MTSKSGFRIQLWLLILFFIVAAGVGIGIAFFIFWLAKKCCFGGQAGIKNSRKIDVAVKWESK